MAICRHFSSVSKAVNHPPINSTCRFIQPTVLAALRLSLSVLLLCIVTAASAAEQLNINHATAAQIESKLPGIGKVKAQAIVDYRNRNGPFDGPEQLLEIKGVGPHTLERIRPLINFDGVRGQFFSRLRQQGLNDQDQVIRQEIKRIVTRAKQVTIE